MAPTTRAIGSSRNSREMVDDSTKDFPKFSGEDVKGWILRYEQFFLIDTIAEDQKPVYRVAIIKRFGTVFDDPMAELKNVKYDNSAKDYQDKFDNLLSRVDISMEHSISLYLGGFPTEFEMGYGIPPRKQLTQKEYEEKRAKNLSFYFDKKFIPGHKCEGQLFSLIVLAENEGSEDEFLDADDSLEDIETDGCVILSWVRSPTDGVNLLIQKLDDP
ncbi:hypothetical protein Tco_1017367 [Tanacetum coccineum]|uniref:Uncharacterized protein n=1 Tax=Tanacetum coccineum TaxID=301880 RepID=A0ABQ5FTV0_9ASTR